MKRLYIIGVGLGNIGLLTPYAANVAAACEKVLATFRVGKLFPQAVCLSLREIHETLANNAHNTTALLVSGDPGFFSYAKSINEKFNNTYQIEIINGINSLQYFAAKLKMTYDNIPVCSMHGRDANLLSKVSYNKKVFVLTGGANNVKTICEMLAERGLGHVNTIVGENLSYENERIVRGRAEEIKEMNFHDLAVMIIENPEPADVYKNLTDDDFIRSDIPMTKEEIRNIILAKLAVNPADVLYDIGAGTGSVSIAMARKAFDGIVYAVEKEPAAVKLIETNREKHKAFNLEIIQGTAPQALEALPVPNAVFIGGSGGNLRGIIACVRAKNPAARIVITAVTLQTLQEIMSIDIEDFHARIVCVNVSQVKKVGAYDMMLAQNPVHIAVSEAGNG